MRSFLETGLKSERFQPYRFAPAPFFDVSFENGSTMETPPKKRKKRRENPEDTGANRPGETRPPAEAERTERAQRPHVMEDTEKNKESSGEREAVTNHDEQEKITNAGDEQSVAEN